MTTDPNLLQVEKVSLNFGGTEVLSEVSFDVRSGEIRAIIGPNGAGKTSMLNCISGFYRPRAGHIYFRGRDLTQVPTHKIAPLGIARTFQNIALYTGLSTLDNLLAARHIHMSQNMLTSMLYWGRGRREEVRHRRMVEEIIDFLEIAHIRKAVVGALPYGLRKRVELGRALALEPELLLLDEPMAGMNVEEKEDMARFILDIHERRGTTIVLIEHDMGLVMDISDRVVVLDFGVKIGDGLPEEVKQNERVIQAYLGEDSSVPG
ncbi:MAG: ABC transporter ATP-binding protein [Candidatus Promineifilaceae bacterium]|nr:ABC transporter ATP-binding protein [Candidatus Promineifilaceae bacterium]